MLSHNGITKSFDIGKLEVLLDYHCNDITMTFNGTPWQQSSLRQVIKLCKAKKCDLIFKHSPENDGKVIRGALIGAGIGVVLGAAGGIVAVVCAGVTIPVAIISGIGFALFLHSFWCCCWAVQKSNRSYHRLPEWKNYVCSSASTWIKWKIFVNVECSPCPALYFLIMSSIV